MLCAAGYWQYCCRECGDDTGFVQHMLAPHKISVLSTVTEIPHYSAVNTVFSGIYQNSAARHEIPCAVENRGPY